MFRLRSVVSGTRIGGGQRLEMARWDATLPPTVDNLVLMTQPEANTHDAAMSALLVEDGVTPAADSVESVLKSTYSEEVIASVRKAQKELKSW